MCFNTNKLEFNINKFYNMKKLVFFLMAVMAICVASCHKSKKSEPVTVRTATQAVLDSLAVGMDSVSADYRYFETTFELATRIDSLDSCKVVKLQSIYQVVDTLKGKPSVWVADFLTDSVKLTWTVLEGAFWTEDVDLRHKDITLSLEDACDTLLKSNVVRPKSKFVVLRCPLGPIDCDAQYIFGNDKSGTVFVNARTGAVSTKDPAFFPDSVAKKLDHHTLAKMKK